MTGPTTRTTMLLMGLIILFAVIIRIITFGGVLGTDDVSIASNALRIAEHGFFVPTGHYGARIGLTIPLSVIFSTFGTGEWQMALIPFASSLLGIVLAFSIGKRAGGDCVGLVAAALLAIYPLDIFDSTTLFPDLPLGATMALTFYLAIRASESEKPMPWLVASGLVWGLAYLIKITAIFLGPAMLALLLLKEVRLKHLLIIGAVFAGVILAENTYYWMETGHFLHRLKVIQGVAMKTSTEFGGGQLWIFPKAWFITFYQVGLYYYLLLAAGLWALIRRDRWLIILLVWIFTLLLWLQFGGNPFSEHYQVKSHLQRYLNILNVPMVILIALFLMQGLKNQLTRNTLAIVVIASSLFFINFNTLNLERQQSAKLAIKYAAANDLFPLYADHTSYSIAKFLLRNSRHGDEVFPVQDHDFITGKTRLISISNTTGYLLLSRESMRFDKDRYFMKGFDVDKLKEQLPVIHIVSNPMNRLAYLQARFLSSMAQLLPVDFLRRKIAATANEMLAGEDVVIFKMSPRP